MKTATWKANLLALVSPAQALPWVAQEQVERRDVLSRMSQGVRQERRPSGTLGRLCRVLQLFTAPLWCGGSFVWA